MGSPCLQPLRILNCSVGNHWQLKLQRFFSLFHYFQVGYLSIFWNLGQIQKFQGCFVWRKMIQNQRLSKSINTARPGGLFLTACSKVSWQFFVASLMIMLGMYAFWCGPNILFRTFLSLSASMLLINLYNVFSSVRGRQFAKCLWSFCPFGMMCTIPKRRESGNSLS